jgi:hypothetical protein
VRDAVTAYFERSFSGECAEEQVFAMAKAYEAVSGEIWQSGPGVIDDVLDVGAGLADSRVVSAALAA